MRNLFALIGFAVVVFLGAGWYLGWYKLDWSTKTDGTTSVHFDVNGKQVTDDIKAGAHKAGEMIENFKAKPGSDDQKSSDDPNFVGPPAPKAAANTTDKKNFGLAAPSGTEARK